MNNCKHKTCEYGNLEIEDSVWRVVTCVDCGKTWNEVYELAYYEDSDGNQTNDTPGK